MEAHTKFDFRRAFVVTSQDITKIWKMIEDKGLVTTAAANCLDGLVRQFESSKSLVRYDNPQRAAITALEISGQSRDPYTVVEISLGVSYLAPISVSIRGEERLVSSMRMAHSDVLEGMKPWYSRIATVELFYVWVPIFVVFVTVIQIMAPSNTPRPAIPFRRALELSAVLLALTVLIGAMVWGVAWARKRFFPVATFSIGQGLARHQHYEQVRWIVIIGFLVSVMASIVAAVLLAV